MERMSDSRRSLPKASMAVLIRVGFATLATSFVVACASGGSGTLAQQASTVATNAQAKLASATASSTDSASASQTATATAETKTATETKTITQPAQSRTVTATTTVSTPGQTTGITGNNTTVAVQPISANTSDSGGGIPWWAWVLIGLGVVGVAIAIFQLGRGRRGGNGGGGSRAATPPSEAGAAQSDGISADPAAQSSQRSQGPPV